MKWTILAACLLGLITYVLWPAESEPAMSVTFNDISFTPIAEAAKPSLVIATEPPKSITEKTSTLPPLASNKSATPERELSAIEEFDQLAIKQFISGINEKEYQRLLALELPLQWLARRYENGDYQQSVNYFSADTALTDRLEVNDFADFISILRDCGQCQLNRPYWVELLALMSLNLTFEKANLSTFRRGSYIFLMNRGILDTTVILYQSRQLKNWYQQQISLKPAFPALFAWLNLQQQAIESIEQRASFNDSDLAVLAQSQFATHQRLALDLKAYQQANEMQRLNLFSQVSDFILVADQSFSLSEIDRLLLMQSFKLGSKELFNQIDHQWLENFYRQYGFTPELSLQMLHFAQFYNLATPLSLLQALSIKHPEVSQSPLYLSLRNAQAQGVSRISELWGKQIGALDDYLSQLDKRQANNIRKIAIKMHSGDIKGFDSRYFSDKLAAQPLLDCCLSLNAMAKLSQREPIGAINWNQNISYLLNNDFNSRQLMMYSDHYLRFLFSDVDNYQKNDNFIFEEYGTGVSFYDPRSIQGNAVIANNIDQELKVILPQLTPLMLSLYQTLMSTP